MAVEIVKFRPEHVRAAAVIERQSFSVPWSEEMISGELINPHAYYFAAEDRGILVGYCGMHLIMDEAYITNIAVTPKHRRLGIGLRLLDKLMNYAILRGAVFLTLEVRKSNLAAQTMYESRGFEIAGIRKGYYGKPAEDALIMTKYIKTGKRSTR
jgi:[ribosomal protein S18]-alanine N-acetyltransferase